MLDEPAWRRATDVAHFHRARDLHRTLVTSDHDFLEDRRFPLVDSPGVIVLSALRTNGVLRKLLAEVDTYLRRQPADAPLAGRRLLPVHGRAGPAPALDRVRTPTPATDPC